MKTLIKLGQTIEACKRKLFDDGYSYDDAHDMVRLFFEDIGFEFKGFEMEADVEEMKKAINHLSVNILN